MITKCIFISHSAKEPETEDFLEKIYAELTKKSFDVLVDRERLNFGDNWKYEIFNWMGSCHCALILFSKNAIENSIWVAREVNILNWRKTQDSNFFLIPIYFDVTPEDIKKSELFTDLNLHEIESLTDRNIEVFVQRLEKLVEKLDIKTPLDEVALQISTRLEDISHIEEKRVKIIEEMHDKNNKEILSWLPNRDPCLVLAVKMLNLGLYKSIDILQYLCKYLETRKIKFIFDLLAPSWVDIRAATNISECALSGERKTVVVLNCNEPFSVEMYVRRASNGLPKEWLLCHYSCVYGADLSEVVTDIEKLLIMELVDTEFHETYESKRKALKTALKARNIKRKPVFVDLQYSKHIAELLPELQDTFPQVTFILVTGKDFPEYTELEDLLKGLHFKFLEPPLEPKAEDQALYEYDSSYSLLSDILKGVNHGI
jgi:hypothetical protein